ncbi:ferritin-like domain-containing protein [Halorubrum sp. DM2]|uniref:ferritin-like domain-containing protein n=1 Tax=Halorubrum sp. DM2 TaxID=2527867 RepID=UPI0024B86FAF|nr:ferritin-like domain-containing protein [Halorubrum sp. DM2]
MNVKARVASEHQLVRLLQVGVVLEEVVEARAEQHYRNLSDTEHQPVSEEVTNLLTETTKESADHRRRLEELIDELDAETIAFEQIQTLVAEQYGATKPDDFDGLLYDQLHSEESAYKFYDDLIESIEQSDVAFSLPRKRLLETLKTIREEEAEGAERVTNLMDQQ